MRLGKVTRHRASRMALLAVALVGSITAAPGFALGRSRESGALVIQISGLPAGERAAVHVSGPHHFALSLRASHRLTGLRAGRYRIVVGTVTLYRAHGGAEAGARAYPSTPSATSLLVKAGATRTMSVRYGTISNPNTRELANGAARVVAGTADDPTAIAVPSSSRPRVGQLLLASSQSQLPRGLVAKVKTVSMHGSQAIVELVPANLQAAFPELSIDEKVPLEPTGQTSATTARAGDAPTSPIAHAAGDFSFDLLAHLSCGSSSIAGAQLHFPITLGSPTYSVTYDQPLFGLPHASATISYSPTIGVHAVFPTGFHCTADTPTIGFGGKVGIPHTSIKVAVTAGVKLEGDLTIGAPVTLDAGLSGSVTGGISATVGRPPTPIFGLSNVSAFGSMSSWTDWSLKVIPELAAEAGFGNFFDLNASVGPALEFHSTPQAWRLNAYDELNAGLKLWRVSASLPTMDSQPHLQPFYHARGSTGSGGTGGSGGGSAGGGTPPTGGRYDRVTPLGPTSGPAGFGFSVGTPSCSYDLHYFVDGTESGYVTGVAQVANGASESAVWNIVASPGGHQISFACQNADGSVTQWTDPGFSVEVTASPTPASLQSTSVAPGAQLIFDSGASAGPSPCPALPGYPTASALRLWLDGNSPVASRNVVMPDGATSEPLSLPATLAAGTYSAFEECEYGPSTEATFLFQPQSVTVS